MSKQILIITDMFSKKVEEHDDQKQNLAVRDKELSALKLEKTDLNDFKSKYQRECA